MKEKGCEEMLISMVIPETLLLSTRQSNEEFEAEAKKAIALKFYNDQKLSLGQAAELAEMGKYEFIRYLGKNNISIFRFESDDLEADLQRDVDNAARYVANE